MFRSNHWIISFSFIVLDALTVYFLFYCATILRSILSPLLKYPPVPWGDVIVSAQMAIGLVLSMFLLQGLYPGYGLTTIKELEKMGKAITMAFILMATISYLNKPFQIFPRSILPIAWSLLIVILPVMRFITRNLFSLTNFYGVPVIVFGEGEFAEDVVTSLNRIRRLGWRPDSWHTLEKTRFKNEFNPASIAILALKFDSSSVELVRSLNQYFRKVVLIQEGENIGSLWVETREIDGLLGLEFTYNNLSTQNILLKRIIDLAGAMFLLILVSPLLIFISILVALDSPGPIFYRQKRLGKEFRRFDILKFRTMVLGAEEILEQLLQKDPLAKAEYDQFHKLEKDPRMTRAGLLLRKYSLDELPQLWNVLKGEMSLTGPRAYMPAELECMGTFAATILRVRPGITGYWQVLGRHSTSFNKRLQMDEYYVGNWSLWMDAYILLRTVLVVISGKGA